MSDARAIRLAQNNSMPISAATWPLPTEIWLHILNFLNLSDTLSFRLCDKYIYELIKSIYYFTNFGALSLSSTRVYTPMIFSSGNSYKHIVRMNLRLASTSLSNYFAKLTIISNSIVACKPDFTLHEDFLKNYIGVVFSSQQFFAGYYLYQRENRDEAMKVLISVKALLSKTAKQTIIKNIFNDKYFGGEDNEIALITAFLDFMTPAQRADMKQKYLNKLAGYCNSSTCKSLLIGLIEMIPYLSEHELAEIMLATTSDNFLHKKKFIDYFAQEVMLLQQKIAALLTPVTKRAIREILLQVISSPSAELSDTHFTAVAFIVVSSSNAKPSKRLYKSIYTRLKMDSNFYLSQTIKLLSQHQLLTRRQEKSIILFYISTPECQHFPINFYEFIKNSKYILSISKVKTIIKHLKAISEKSPSVDVALEAIKILSLFKDKMTNLDMDVIQLQLKNFFLLGKYSNLSFKALDIAMHWSFTFKDENSIGKIIFLLKEYMAFDFVIKTIKAYIQKNDLAALVHEKISYFNRNWALTSSRLRLLPYLSDIKQKEEISILLDNFNTAKKRNSDFESLNHYSCPEIVSVLKDEKNAIELKKFTSLLIDCLNEGNYDHRTNQSILIILEKYLDTIDINKSKEILFRSFKYCVLNYNSSFYLSLTTCNSYLNIFTDAQINELCQEFHSKSYCNKFTDLFIQLSIIRDVELTGKTKTSLDSNSALLKKLTKEIPPLLSLKSTTVTQSECELNVCRP